ncbi:type I methionyl aminopeptidase [Thiotrichales bacterium 19S9-12]|nr:type I methionyl aminopeptidase [Thiotrichales bacterium 19S9-11]MCF6811285.1 type I methionyl aminopeptidase [Thiotrichales bacterium 19S9-12]
MPNIVIKTSDDIEKMRAAGKLAAEVLTLIGDHVVPGITTEELNNICHQHITEVQKATPAPLNYHGFPKSICTSVNHVVCHGIPGPKKLKNGDIINIDITVLKDGYHGDTSKMFYVGEASILAKRLVEVTHQCLWRGIDLVKPGATLGDIAKAIQTHAHKHKFSVVKDFCGHGIGKGFHEDPQVLHYYDPNNANMNITLKEGMIFTIEPMINAGNDKVTILKDKWTAITKDRSLSAQWEHTILVTKDGFEVLTLRDEEKL